MAKGFGKQGLTLGYRITYRLRMIGLTIFGPAELSENTDPKIALARERAARVAQAQARRQS